MQAKASRFTGRASNLLSVESTLGDLIASLPEEERFMLTLNLLRGMSHAEIAESLGVPVKSVATVIKSGKERLLSTLDFPPLA